MKKTKKSKQQNIVGGGRHWHWICDVNNFRSIRYNSTNACNNAANSHAKKYKHTKNVNVIGCTGNC